MKIAVISDIHGNMEALIPVLQDIQQEQAEQILICGDLAMAGPEPVETLDFMMKLAENPNIVIIQGNTDEMIIKSTGEANDPYTPPNKIMAESLKYAQQVIRQEQKEFLAQLPADKSLKVGEVSILMVHGSPRRNNEDILPAQDIEKISEMIAGTTEDIIFCGHTHLPAGYQIEKQTVVNVGSVGRPFTETPQACYALLVIPDLSKKEFEISHRFIDYNFQSAAEKLARQPFEGAAKLAEMLVKATSRYPEN